MPLPSCSSACRSDHACCAVMHTTRPLILSTSPGTRRRRIHVVTDHLLTVYFSPTSAHSVAPFGPLHITATHATGRDSVTAGRTSKNGGLQTWLSGLSLQSRATTSGIFRGADPIQRRQIRQDRTEDAKDNAGVVARLSGFLPVRTRTYRCCPILIDCIHDLARQL